MCGECPLTHSLAGWLTHSSLVTSTGLVRVVNNAMSIIPYGFYAMEIRNVIYSVGHLVIPVLIRNIIFAYPEYHHTPGLLPMTIAIRRERASCQTHTHTYAIELLSIALSLHGWHFEQRYVQPRLLRLN